MSRRLTLRIQAEVDIDEAVGWYETERAGLGIEFIRSLNLLLERVQEQPFQFPVVEQDVRRGLVNRFPFAVFFTVNDDEVLVTLCFICVDIQTLGRDAEDSLPGPDNLRLEWSWPSSSSA